MTAFIITQPASGVVLGAFEGETAADAVDAMARDAGYDDAADMNSINNDDDPDDLDVTASPASIELHDAFYEHSRSGTTLRGIVASEYQIDDDHAERLIDSVDGVEDWEAPVKLHEAWAEGSVVA